MAANNHVPAWKRLGLKLKFANDTPDHPLPHVDTNGSQNGLDAKKRKVSLSAAAHSHMIEAIPRAKKRKILPKSAKSSQTAAFTGSPQSSALAPTLASVEQIPSEVLQQDPTLVSAASPIPKKRKSVSFTPETKVQDGDSTKQLYTAWLALQDKGFDPTTAAHALRHTSPPKIDPSTLPDFNTSPKAPQVTRTKLSKKDRSKLSADALTLKPITPTLQYLQSYHTSKSTWKFNKSKQNQVLKYAFDVAKIPRSYDPALAAYMEGLEKTSKARKRLIEEALAIRLSDEEIEGIEEWANEGGGMETTTDSDDDDSDDDEDPDDSNEEDGNEEIDLEAAAAARAAKQAAKAAKTARRMSEPLKKKCYRMALQKYKTQLKEKLLLQEERDKLADPLWRHRLLKRKRAELILWSIGVDDFGPNGMYQEMPREATMDSLFRPGTVEVVDVKGGMVGAVDGRAGMGKGVRVGGKRKRKRKRRTGMPDDDSSEEVSSSSDSEVERAKTMKEMRERRNRSETPLSSFKSDVGSKSGAVAAEASSENSSASETESGGSDSGRGGEGGSDSDDSD